jgi:hypothetical protein
MQALPLRLGAKPVAPNVDCAFSIIDLLLRKLLLRLISPRRLEAIAAWLAGEAWLIGLRQRGSISAYSGRSATLRTKLGPRRGLSSSCQKAALHCVNHAS